LGDWARLLKSGALGGATGDMESEILMTQKKKGLEREEKWLSLTGTNQASGRDWRGFAKWGRKGVVGKIVFGLPKRQGYNSGRTSWKNHPRNRGGSRRTSRLQKESSCVMCREEVKKRIIRNTGKKRLFAQWRERRPGIARQEFLREGKKRHD